MEICIGARVGRRSPADFPPIALIYIRNRFGNETFEIPWWLIFVIKIGPNEILAGL